METLILFYLDSTHSDFVDSECIENLAMLLFGNESALIRSDALTTLGTITENNDDDLHRFASRVCYSKIQLCNFHSYLFLNCRMIGYLKYIILLKMMKMNKLETMLGDS